MRLIDADLLKKNIAKWLQGGDPQETVMVKLDDIAVSVIMEIDEQPTVHDSNGWIPCSERLPEVEADVLVSLRSLDVYTGFRANTEGCFYVEGEGYVEFENVLAWQPLLEPYKELTT